MARRRNPASGFPPYAAPGASLFSSWHRNRADVMFCLPLYGLALPLPAPLFFQGSREKKVESSAWLARLGATARQNRRASKVGNREKKVERSAWLARLGAPARQNRRASLCVNSSLLYRAAKPPRSTEAHCKVTTHFSLHSPPYPLPYTGALKRASHALSSTLSSLPPTLHRRAQARQPRTPLYLLLPILYFGSPLHSGHALPSPPYSLLSTLSCFTPV